METGIQLTLTVLRHAALKLLHQIQNALGPRPLVCKESADTEIEVSGAGPKAGINQGKSRIHKKRAENGVRAREMSGTGVKVRAGKRQEKRQRQRQNKAEIEAFLPGFLQLLYL